METCVVDSESLIDLVDRVRAAGFNIGARHYIAVHQLVVRLVAQDTDLRSPDRLRSLLGPVLCNNAIEQEEFKLLFDDWQISRLQPDLVNEVAADEEKQEVRLNPKVEQRNREIVRKRGLIKLAARGIAVVLVIASALTVYNVFWPKQVTVPAVSNVQPQPKRPPAAEPSPTSDDKAPTATSSNSDSPIQNVGPVEQIWQLPEEVVIPVWLQLILGLLLVVLIVFLVLRIRLQYALQEVLLRKASDVEPEIKRMLLGRSTTSLHSSGQIERMARSFRRWMAIPSTKLNIPATVSKTVAKGGRFVPIFGTYQSRPAYLFLIQRVSAGDQAARFIGKLVEHLKSQSVLADCFYYIGDPRTCFPARPDSEPVTLRELANQYPDSRVVLFAPAHSFFNQWTGEQESWVDKLQLWNERIILTSEPAGQWGHLHDELEHRFIVLPATVEGFSALTDRLDHGRPCSRSRDQQTIPIPQELISRPHYWIDKVPVDPAGTDQVMTSLHSCLGDAGYYWLSACAVFPLMHPNLTLYLGEELRTEHGTKLGEEQTFLQLSLLPWFRHGYMPDWLRHRLVAGLPRHREHETRAALNKLVDEAERIPGEALTEAPGVDIDVAEDSLPNKLPARKWRFWRRPQGNPANSTSQKNRDYVFHAFMSGQRVDGLVHRLTRELATQPAIPISLNAPLSVERPNPEWVHRLPLHLAAVVLIGYFIGWFAGAPELFNALSFVGMLLITGLPFALLALTAYLRRLFTSFISAVACITIVVTGIRFPVDHGPGPISWLLQSAFWSPATLLTVAGFAVSVAAANRLLDSPTRHSINAVRLGRLSKTTLVIHLVSTLCALLCLLYLFVVSVSSMNYHPGYIEEQILIFLPFACCVCSSVSVISEISLGIATQSRRLLLIPGFYIVIVLYTIILNSPSASMTSSWLVFVAAAIGWIILSILTFIRNGGVPNTFCDVNNRAAASIVDIVTIIAVSVSLAGMLIQSLNIDVGDVMCTVAKLLLAGVAGSAVFIGSSWKRYPILLIGIAAWIAICGSWSGQPLLWWFAFDSGNCVFRSVWALIVILGFCVALCMAWSLFGEGRSPSWSEQLALSRRAVILHLILSGAAVLCAFNNVTRNPAISDPAISILEWSCGLIILGLAGAVMVELILAWQLKSRVLGATALGFPFYALLLACLGKREIHTVTPIWILSHTVIGFLWVLICRFVYSRNGPSQPETEMVSTSPPTDEFTQRAQWRRQRLLREFAVITIGIGLLSALGLLLVLNGPHWMNAQLRVWQQKPRGGGSGSATPVHSEEPVIPTPSKMDDAKSEELFGRDKPIDEGLEATKADDGNVSDKPFDKKE